MNFTPEYLLIQGISIVAFAVSLWGIISPNDNKLKKMMVTGTLIMIVHYALLGAWLVVVTLLLNTARTWLSIYKRGLKWFLIVTTIHLSINAPLVSTWTDALPLTGSTGASAALFMSSGITLRIVFIFSSMLWFGNNYVLHSIGGMMIDTLNVCAHLYSISLIYRLQKKEALLAKLKEQKKD